MLLGLFCPLSTVLSVFSSSPGVEELAAELHPASIATLESQLEHSLFNCGVLNPFVIQT